MFSILCDVVIDTLQRISSDVERFPIKDSKHRHAAGCFIAVYATLHDVEVALVDVAQELNRLTIEHQTPIKVVIRRKLDILMKSADNFGEKAIMLHALPLAHVNPYLAGTEKKGWYTRPPYRVVNLFPLACPAPILENGRASYLVEFPTVIPSRKLLPHGEDRDFVWRLIRRQLQFQTVDIRDQGSIRRALIQAPQDIERMENRRKEFADFIQHQFPLEEILT
jgi:hypothetical protein